MSALIYSILVGGLGGNLAGLVLRNLNLGLLRNTVIGAFGGFIAQSIVSDMQMTLGLWPLLGLAALGGCFLTAVVGAVMNLRAR